jgi:hypothetical protein
MPARREILLLALTWIGAAVAVAAPQDDAAIATCRGPSLPFYAFAAHGGDRLAVYRGQDWPNYYATFGLVNLDIPKYVLMENAGTLRLSRDRGCTFEDLAAVQDSPLFITTAPGGGAYAFALNGTAFYEIAPDGSTFVVTQRRTPAAGILGVGVDPANPRHVYLGNSDGQMHQSTDGGANWSRLGNPPALNAFGYRFAFDPHNPRHAIFGAVTYGGWVTFDGGSSWAPMNGLSETGGPVNGFNAVFSPVDGNVAWVMGLDIDQADLGDPSGGRHFYLSNDGGRQFTPVVDQSADVTLTNGPEMTPHPNLPHRIAWVFGSSFSGLDIYQFDADSMQLKKRHYPGLLARTVTYASGNPRNMLIGMEGGIPFAD